MAARSNYASSTLSFLPTVEAARSLFHSVATRPDYVQRLIESRGFLASRDTL